MRLICSLASIVVFAAIDSTLADETDDATKRCLDCICYASTKCDVNARCDAFCGAYQISEPYWIDAGKPGSASFQQCALNKNCAEETIISYMNKWGTDCDGDGQVSCGDYARMHKAGRTGCSAPWVLNTPYWTQFQNCMQPTGRQLLDARAQ